MSESSYKCPQCAGSNFKRWEFPHLNSLFWIFNPVSVINEIVLGQRFPKIHLICKDCEGAFVERAYIPCPSCDMMHFQCLRWGWAGCLKWRGLSCPSCGEAIPCLWNVFSLLVLLVTFPLWCLPYFLHFRKKPLKPLYGMVEGKAPTPKALTKKTWIYMGAGFAGSMFICFTLFPILTGDRGGDNWASVIGGLIGGLIGGVVAGFLCGYFMWFFYGRRRKKKGA